MQNISAVMEELCLQRITGYMPAKNIGSNVSNKIKAILQEIGYIKQEPNICIILLLKQKSLIRIVKLLTVLY